MSRVGTVYRYQEEAILVDDTVDGGAEEAFSALQAAYLSEGLVPDGLDAQSGIVSLSRVEWSGTWNGERLSAFLDCGLSSTGRPMADASRVVAALAAQVKEAGPHSARVTLRLDASAYPYENGSGAVRGCITTGELERAIVGRLKGVLASADAAADPTLTTPGAAPPVTALPAVPVAPSVTGSAGLSITAGDQLRVWLAPGERLSGALLQVRSDTLVLGMGRRTSIPLTEIQRIQVKRTRRTTMLVSAVVGVAAGVTLATTTDLGIHGQHAIQGRILNPGLGALAGGVVGILVANRTFGASWVEVPVGVARVR